MAILLRRGDSGCICEVGPRDSSLPSDGPRAVPHADPHPGPADLRLSRARVGDVLGGGRRVLDRIRVWLPCLLALSANSPFWKGQDTSYASFRSQVLGRWPVSGPTEVFGTANKYRALVEGMVASEVILDEGMVYFDARCSNRYPTVEIRVADVCLDVRDAILLMSHDAVAARLALHTAAAAQASPSMTRKNVTAHVLRHTAAMRLLAAGIDSSIIALWLGHESIETIQICLHANMKTKEDALARITPTGVIPGRYKVVDDTLLAFLQGL